jgi:MFS family permease
MSERGRSTTRASAPTRNVRTRDGATRPRARSQTEPQVRRAGVSRDGAQLSRDGAQPDTAATPTFTEVTPRAVKYATVVAFLAWTFAVYDYISFGTLLPKIADTFHWSTSFATAVATWVSVGTFATAMLVGPMLDYLGRKKAMVVTTVGAALSSGLSALAPGTLYLICVRAFSGLGYSEQAVNATYLNELYGKRAKRGFIYSAVQSGWPVGALFAAGMAAILVPIVGWRGTFAVATFPAFVIALLSLRLVESPKFERMRHARRLVKAGRVDEARDFAKREGLDVDRVEHNTFRQLFEADQRRHTLFLGGAFLLNWIGIQIFDVLGTTVLKDGTGVSFSSSLVLLLVGNLVAAGGYLSHGLLGDRFGRRNVTAFGWVAAGISFAVMLFGPHTIAFTMVFYAIGLVFVLGTYASLFFYIGESFPSRVRGTGTSLMNAMGPVGAIVGSALFTAAQESGLSVQVSAAVVGCTAVVLSGLCILGARNVSPKDDVSLDEAELRKADEARSAVAIS